MDYLSVLKREPISSKLLRVLPEGVTHSLFILDSYIEARGKLDGPSHQSLLGRCVRDDVRQPDDLEQWLQQRRPMSPEHTLIFHKARRKAEIFIQGRIWAATWKTTALSTPQCPQVLFGMGIAGWDQHWLAVFNSRKARLVQPAEGWLQDLRLRLPELTSHNLGIASSIGTFTYDLLTAYAQDTGIPLLLVLPIPLQAAGKDSPLALLSDSAELHQALTCQSKAMRCSKAVRSVCRDRLLSSLADVQWALELRTGGNLHKILQTQQMEDRRTLLISVPKNRNKETAGNFELLEALPSAKRITAGHGKIGSRASPKSESAQAAASAAHRIEWCSYLYHYTRSCPGPWPNQSYRQYLLSLLKNELFSGHTALDTLVRILLEEKIRASNKLVRGEQPVVSWSAVPPVKFQNLKQWNPALVRWTVDPYGIAVSLRVLRKQGAKPVIYGPETTYTRLQPADRFRYQRHQPPSCSWKYEREWRLPEDFDLSSASSDDGFIFVQEPGDLELLSNHVRHRLPVIVLSVMTAFAFDRPENMG
jgi:hypothetical protein